MPTNHTPHYNLNQWERDDRVLMEDFNADNAKIDAALGAKAEAATVTALSKTVSAHTTALGKKGNCRIWTTSYIGDGTTSRTLTFPAKPLMLFIMGENIILRYIYGAQYAMCSTSGEGGAACPTVWNGNTLTWSFSGGHTYICNRKGEMHYVVALMPVDG